MKTRIACITFVLLASVGLLAQQQGALSFEVASIKPSAPQPMGMMRMNMSTDGGMARYTGVPLRDLIRTAYRVKDFQLEGPEWMGSERFDIVAKLPDGAKEDQIPEMLQSLLAERFKLTLHRDMKEHAIYALVVGKMGAKLKPAEVQTRDSAAAPAQPGGGPPDTAANASASGGAAKASGGTGGPAGGPRRGSMMFMLDPAGVHLKAPAATVANMADAISRFTERPIVDMTGIQGQYEFDLTFAPEKMPNIPRGAGPMPPPGGERPAEAAGEPGESIFDAVQRYGLKLDPRKAPLEVLTIDHIEKTPTEN